MALKPDPTWRIIPVSKYLITPIYKPFRPFGRGTTPVRGLRSPWLLTTYPNWDDPPRRQGGLVAYDTVDGRNPAPPAMYKNPVNNGINYLSVGTALHGFQLKVLLSLPVLPLFFHWYLDEDELQETTPLQYVKSFPRPKKGAEEICCSFFLCAIVFPCIFYDCILKKKIHYRLIAKKRDSCSTNTGKNINFKLYQGVQGRCVKKNRSHRWCQKRVKKSRDNCVYP